MTSVAVSSLPPSDASFPYPHSARLYHEHHLPSIRSAVFEEGSDAPGIVNNQERSQQRNTTATCDEEEDEALPLLVSMSGGSGSAASTLSRLPAVSSILRGALSANQNDLIMPGASSFPCEQQQQLSLQKHKQSEVERTASPTSDVGRRLSAGSLPMASPSSSPIPFSLSSSSSSSSPWLSSPSRPTPIDASADYDSAVTAAASRLMELSDLTSVSQQRDNASSADDRTLESRAKSPTTTTTTTRCPRRSRQQHKIEKVREAIERERLRAQRLQQQLQAVLREKEELLEGDSFQGTNPLPSFATIFAGTQAENRATSDMGNSALLPPITSIPALSPYLKQQSSFASPATRFGCAPRCLFAGGADERSGELCLKRAREDDDSDDDRDGEYQPNKKVKRSRSFSEGGQRLQSVKTTIAPNKKSSFGQGSDALTFIGRRHRANSEGHVRFASRLDAATKKPGLLCFMKDHPHASFWLARSNLSN